MGILSNCSCVASDQDVAITLIIFGAVVLGLLIIAIAIGYCVSKTQNAKTIELEKRNEFEKDKIEQEQTLKERKDRYDAAWRTIEQSWKENSKVDAEKVADAWEYIKNIWKDK